MHGCVRVQRSLVGMAMILTCSVLASTAQAQVCGDADGNGQVTVTDGVNVLRAAAGLSSGCAARASLCDVDGNATVTVTDGVNVLRSAAGLSASLNCRDTGSGVARFAGRYEGTYSGDDHGTYEGEFDCQGAITGSGISTDFDEEFDVDGTVSSSGAVTFVAGFTTADATFSGSVGDDGRVSGQWNDPVEHLSGSFKGARTDAFVCNQTATIDARNE